MATGSNTTEAAEQAGIPQLDFAAFPNQIFWLVVFLVVLFLIMKRVVIPRIDGLIDQRRQRIREDVLEAEKLNEEAEQLRAMNSLKLTAARKEAEGIAAAARAEIKEAQDSAIAEVNERIRAKTSEAEARIDEIRRSAAENIGAIAHDAALEIVSALVPSRIDERRVESAVQARTGGVVQ